MITTFNILNSFTKMDTDHLLNVKINVSSGGQTKKLSDMSLENVRKFCSDRVVDEWNQFNEKKKSSRC